MKIKTKIAWIILVVTLSTLACSISEPGSRRVSETGSTSKSTFTDKSEIVVIELKVKPDMRSNVLRINNIELDEGEITLRLLDPEEEIIEEELLVSPTKYSERFELDIIPGVWKLELDMHDASGSYDVKWEAKR